MFRGSMVAVVTPMQADGALDFAALAGLVEFHIENGTDALIAVGTTGESATLDFEEHIAVVAKVVELVRRRIPVIAGTGANSTREALHLTQRAMEAGADACLLVTPYYNKPTQEGLYRHYKLIADRVPIPQILYNVPGRTACDMQPDTVERLADTPNIIGIKEASTLERIQELVRRCGDRLDVYSGDDGIAAEAILSGAKGNISVTANVAPRLMHEMCAAALAGDRTRTEAINSQVAGLHKALFLESNPIPVKWAVSQLGLIPPGIRLPLTPLSEQFQPAVRAAMQQAGVL
ncbi:MAG TPA: 4-hydroxy-tetrahydrodipicolinate synthase [Candidatus Competibacteraceae bacterium]|nr:4-hydroxy-tetrahydrodipicolinate synthase [Candidatus Competibacteraceae bacterium]HRZ06805.1 4-hydroxy-tetrahydrodipicolinate synthase [Candidatus Competibacteraceae bacterium]HSA45906.1 4-hydroxy-tetrahydrodipicolinate synthase [Candidatus Competibacteraceae bacterium]